MSVVYAFFGADLFPLHLSDTGFLTNFIYTQENCRHLYYLHKSAQIVIRTQLSLQFKYHQNREITKSFTYLNTYNYNALTAQLVGRMEIHMLFFNETNLYLAIQPLFTR